MPSHVENHSRGPGQLSCSGNPQPPPKWAGKTVRTKRQSPVLWRPLCFPRLPPHEPTFRVVIRSQQVLHSLPSLGPAAHHTLGGGGGEHVWSSSTTGLSDLPAPLWGNLPFALCSHLLPVRPQLNSPSPKSHSELTHLDTGSHSTDSFPLWNTSRIAWSC